MFYSFTRRNTRRAQLSLLGLTSCAAFYSHRSTAIAQQNQPQSQPNNPRCGKSKVWRILFTGGPCAGKSTALSTARDFLNDMGYEVYTIEESATFLNRGNIKWSYETLPYSQYAITKMQKYFEDIYFKFAQEMSILENKPTIVLMDRGLMDGLAYVPQDMFIDTLKLSGIDIELSKRPCYDEIYDRYDLVLHLVSAAKGAPEFYATEEYRSESVRDAIILDDKILSVYAGHEDRRILYSENKFDDKIKGIISNICDKIDIPNIRTAPVKYVIHITDKDSGEKATDIFQIIEALNNVLADDFKRTDDCVLCADVEAYYVERAYLNKTDEFNYTVLRKTVKLDYSNSGEDNNISEDQMAAMKYTLLKKRVQLGQELSESTTLDKRGYSEYMQRINEDHLLKLISLRFEYRRNWWEVEIIQSPQQNKGLVLLRLFGRPNGDIVDEYGMPIQLPKCMVIEKNVTDDDRYKPSNLISNTI